jgi:DNA-binding SARP family transcriptional activator
MWYAILGALEVYDQGQQLPLRGSQQRTVLAVLLLNANRVVSTDRLVECLWNEHPPAAARSLLQGCVAQLRLALRNGRGPRGRPLVTRAPGYCLEVLPDELDLDRFEQLVAAATRLEAARSRADSEQSAGLLDQALSLWRGPALDGVVLDACQADVARLDERRLMVQEQRVDLELQLRRYASAVGELESLTRANPLRERFWAQLMLAQYGADRQADALASYERLRRTLVEELGVEPNAGVRNLHRAILSGADPAQLYRADGQTPHPDPEAGAGPTGPRALPAQLPPAVAAFTGRDAHLKHLDALLSNTDDATALGVVSGTAGVGKTALAVHWGHRVREWFVDGQLYVNLHGYAPVAPMRPIEALAGFLQALGVSAEQIPVEPDQAAALYRTLLADKRMLVVLDNARSAEQVRPLLPGSPGCVVVVTGRDRLGGLVARDGARPLTLDVFDHHEAVTLLARVLGEQRVRAEPEESAELVDRCGRLPLALRIAAANLALHPHRRIADQVAGLAAGDRLSALEIEGDEASAVRVAFDLSYDVLTGPARLLFRRLGLAPTHDVTAPAAAALARSTVEEAARLLDRLARAHLVDQDDSGRFALHDLLRLYAAERARHEDSAEERDAATRRLFTWYLHTADAAARQLYPDAVRLPLAACGIAAPVTGFADHAGALAWLDAELANLVATIQHAAEHGPRPVAWLLTDILRGYFMLRVPPVEWEATTQAGLSAAEADDTHQAQMAMCLSIAGFHQRQNRYDQAIEHFHRALTINRRVGWPEGESAALGNLGAVYLSSGRLRDAADQSARGLEVDRRIGWLSGQAVKLGNLGVANTERGQLEEAAAQLREALALFCELGSRHGEALGLGNLGAVLHQLGRYPEAIDHLTRAVALSHELGDRGTEADHHNVLAEIHRDAGRLSTALDLATVALARAVDVGERHYEADALNILGSVHLRRDEFGRAEDYHHHALDLARRTGTQSPEISALIGLAEARRCAGDPEQARSYAAQAVALGRSTEHRVLEGQALVALANATLDIGRHEEAAELASAALDLQCQTGCRLGVARALVALGHASSRSGHDSTDDHWQRANQIFNDIGASGPQTQSST